MKNIKILNLAKYADPGKFEFVEDGIYKDLNDTDGTNHRLALSFELEDGEDTQYPIEDVLDKYLVYVSDFLEEEHPSSASIMNHELAGELSDLRDAKSIIGKRVYNREFADADGVIRIDLAIE